MGASPLPPASLINKRFTLPFLALLAVLAVGLLFLLPGGLLQAQDGDARMEYAENGTDPVATYTGLDPEGRPIYWSLNPVDAVADLNNDGDFEDAGEAVDDNHSADFEHFMISADGVLTFKLSPNYEMPREAVMTNDNTNTYNIVVVAYDDALGVTGREDTYKKVTVTVTDVDEDGSISLSAQQPQVGVGLTTTLTDQDATDEQQTDAKRKWEQSSAMDGPWIVIVGSTEEMYSPVAGVVGKYLRATVTYTDEHGDDKTAMGVSAHAVRAVPAGGNAAPEFSSEAGDRTVKENSPPGTNVGKPLTAGDAGDILTYTMTGDDAGDYAIHPATGQITVGPRAMLNRDAADFEAGTHQVTVTATDPWGITVADDQNALSAVSVPVIITIDNVNEAPTVTGGATKVRHKENTVITEVVATYAATDQESTGSANANPCTSGSTGSICTWSLSGVDRGDFSISNDEPTPGQLKFKKAPNFESPADADMDNMYMVTVVATDNGTPKMTATRDVVITVTNADDEGEITFSSVQPRVRIPFTASLTDEDGVVAESVKWQWYNANPGSDNNGTLDTDADTKAIAKAKSATYTPKPADAANGDITLYVWASYTDGFGPTSSTGASASMVEANQANQAPQFEDDNDKVITATTTSVAERTEAITTDDDDPTDNPDDNVVPPVDATDPNGDTDTLTYTLGGKDAALFRVRQNGQIEVGADTTLDYERKTSYMVTVMATDPSLASATIDVTIMVTDVNEAPVIAGEDDLTKEFGENSTSNIQTFSARDPEGRTVYWSLEIPDPLPTGVDLDDHADNASFAISSSGALKFMSPPNYERPRGEDISSENTNTYKVVVFASDDAPGAGIETPTPDVQGTDPIMRSGRKLTVRVTNVKETGSVTVDRRYPQVDVAIRATLTDGDATNTEIAAADWQWYRGSTALSAAASATYTPQVADVGASTGGGHLQGKR